MILPVPVVIGTTALYLIMLFVVAFLFEKKYAQGKNYADNIVIYVLALAIYATTWTFYGNVGLAASKGYLFLSVYLGPSLFFIIWAHFIKRILRVKKEYNITSLAELISIRYGKSSSVAALVTCIAIVGIIPYLALQLKAISTSFAFITTGNSAGNASIAIGIGLLISATIFTILFGFRNLSQTKRHPGVIIAIAIQSVVKLVAFLAAGIFIVYFLYDGFGDIFFRISQDSVFLAQQQSSTPSYSLFLSYLLLSMAAIIFLPRQFQVTVVENTQERHVQAASWLLPFYFGLITLFVFPIAMAGILKGYDVKSADLFMLFLVNDYGGAWLSLLVFIGGVSAALGMIIFETVALTTMASNHLLMPFLERFRPLSFLGRYILFLRWLIVAMILSISLIFERTIGSSYLLVKIGMISFAAVLQFAPVVIGGMYWKKGSKRGALLGMWGGFLVWGYCAVLPAFVRSGWASQSILDNGPFGIHFLRPEHLFGISSLDPLAIVVLFSMIVNIGLYVAGSILFAQGESEKDSLEDFIRVIEQKQSSTVSSVNQETNIAVTEKMNILSAIFSRYLNAAETEQVLRECREKVKLEQKEMMRISELVTLRSVAEKLLANYIGTPAANEALNAGGLFAERETKDLAEVYIRMAEQLKLTPEEFSQKIEYFTEKQKMISSQKDELERLVNERTKKLEEAVSELKEINDLSVGRELKMMELKKRIHELENEA